MIYAIYGIVQFQTQRYMIVVDQAEVIGSLAGRSVYQALGFKYVPLGRGMNQNPEDQPYKDRFNKFFKLKCFYFSLDYDLTSNFKKNVESNFDIKDCDSRFFYNEIHVQELAEKQLEDWIHPFICGVFESKQFTLNSKSLGFSLITRRDKTRAGMRFMSRGADITGNVSNFAETEQILCFSEDEGFRVFSYLQIRGSIPLLWKQTPNLKWAPQLKIESNPQKNRMAYEAHIRSMENIYDHFLMINLIDKKKSQQLIGQQFLNLFNGFKSKAGLIWFDFHDECKKMQWHNLSRLVDESAKYLKEYGYGEFDVKSGVSFFVK